jgi:ribonuclease P/MRP protein subunit POP1
MAEDNTPLVQARRRRPRTTRARIRAETAKRLGILAKRKEKKRLLKQASDAKALGDVSMEDATEKPSSASAGVVGRKPRPKIRRDILNEPLKPGAKFRRRQINKTWLPTHTWHAKRARMTEPRSPLWGFAIPMTPNEKIYRPTHRAQGNRGAIVWDTSYFSTMRLFGHYSGIERVLRKLGVTKETCWNDKGRKWRGGTRSWTGLLKRELRTGTRDVTIGTILWNPIINEQEALGTPDAEKRERQVFIRVHPSAFLEVFSELVRLVKMETPRLHVEDLRFEIGSIELTGPASTELLHAVLTPYASVDGADTNHIRLFRGIRGLTNAASLPTNAVLGFHVQDPRLRHPPRKDDTSEARKRSDESLLQLLTEWPAEESLGPYALFDRKARHTASGLPSQKHINRRRGTVPPGSQLKATETDPKIPVLLLATRASSETQTQGNWTLIAPWSCIQHFWHSIVRCPLTSGGNPRFGGVNELRQVAFERNQPWFPADYIATNSGFAWELAEREKRKREWERRPKSKRTAWDSLDLGGGRKGEVGDGLACDFEALFGMPKSGVPETAEVGDKTGDTMDVDEDAEGGVKVADTPSPSLRDLRAMSKADFIRLSSKQTSTEAPKNTILTTKIVLCSSGVAKSRARVYRLPSAATPTPISSNAEVPATMPPADTTSALPHDLRAKWLALATRSPSRSNQQKAKPAKDMDLEARKRMLAQELVAPPEQSNGSPSYTLDPEGHHLLVPDSEDLIGFVTSGSFSLSEGHGMAIASLAVDKVLPGVRQNAKEGHFCIVRNAGESVGWLARWELV